MENYQYIISTGSLSNGFRFFGPFADGESAIKFAEEHNFETWEIETLEAI
jgi:hypothetical protein